MNKRIKKLLNEATSGHEQEHDRSKVMTVSDEEMDKFAELIVQECCHVMESLPSSTYHVGRSRMSEEIKKHFGVKE
jgi:hypothetical protein